MHPAQLTLDVPTIKGKTNKIGVLHMYFWMTSLDLGISLPRGLVVDDEPINLVIKKMLERQRGFGVNSFDGSDLALRIFTSGLYDLLLLDIRTRNMNGIDLYNRIRKIDDNIKVCFMSANFYYYEETRNRLVASDEVNSSFLQKPFESEELLQCIDKLIA
jgi:DNA-binding response OmpR family regulator